MAETVILAQQTFEDFTLFSDANMFGVSQANWFTLQEGSYYNVQWDGTTYNVVAYALSMNGYNAVVLGNEAYLKGETTEISEPFVIYHVLDNGLCVLGSTTDTVSSTPHTVAIYEVAGSHVLLAQQTLEGFVDNNAGVYGFSAEGKLFTFENGKSYRVLWDGDEYTVTAYELTDADLTLTVIGNPSFIGMGEDTSEPFFMYYMPADAVGNETGASFIVTSDTTTDSHTVAVYLADTSSGASGSVDAWLLIKQSTLVAMADAIRETLTTEGKLSPVEYPSKIREVAASGGGGSSADVRYVTFRNGDTVLYVKPVAVGDDCVNVLDKGLIETPTKESTVQYNYTYSGWALTADGTADGDALSAVTEDRTVYAAYTASTRRYNICFYDGETLLTAMQVAYGSTPAYTTEKDGYNFEGWSPEIVPVTGDANYYAQWSSALTFAGASWADIARISEAGEAASTFKVGDTRTEIIGGNTVTLTIVDFDADIQSDGTTVAGMTIISAEQYSSNYYNIEPGFNGDWGKSGLFTNVNSIYNSMSSELQAVVKTVRKKYCAYGSSGASGTIDSKVWIPSVGEIGYNLSPTNSKYVFSTAHSYLDRPYAITGMSPRFFVPTSSYTYDFIFTRTMCDYSSSYTPYQYWAIVPFTTTSSTPYIKEQYYSNKGRIRIGFCV